MTTADSTARADDRFALLGGPSAPVFAGITLAIVVEGAGVHLFFATMSQIAAWTVTTVNVATLAWLWRNQRGLRKSAITVTGDDVEINLGRQLRCRVARSNVSAADVVTWRSLPEPAPGYSDWARPEDPNVVITFRVSVPVRFALGITRAITRIGLRVADPERVVAALRSDPANDGLAAPAIASARTPR